MAVADSLDLEDCDGESAGYGSPRARRESSAFTAYGSSNSSNATLVAPLLIDEKGYERHRSRSIAYQTREAVQHLATHIHRHRRHWTVACIVAVFPLGCLIYLYTAHSLAACLPSKFRFGLAEPNTTSSSTENESAVYVPQELLDQGWQPFDTLLSAPYQPLKRPLSPLESQLMFSQDCAEAWIARGELCDDIRRNGLPESQLDVVWTWAGPANQHGTDWRNALGKSSSAPQGRRSSRFSSSRAAAVVEMPEPRQVVSSSAFWAGRLAVGGGLRKMLLPGANEQHFRSHHELRYSQRSAVQNLPFAHNFHIVAGDLPVCGPNTTDEYGDECQRDDEDRVGQVPSWLKAPDEQDSASRLQVDFHWDLFKTPNASAAETWRGNTLPNYNSLAIESQLPNLNTKTENLFYLNDDGYIIRSLAPSDLFTPLFGPVLRVQRDLLVSASAKGQSLSTPDGEWPGLEYSNWLLNQRFGERKRPYLVHEGKTLSRPLLDEVATVWAHELAETAQIRFRGQQTEVNTMFLATYYLMEKHREALLWSYFVRVSGTQNWSSRMTVADRQALLAGLRSSFTNETAGNIAVTRPEREAFSNQHASDLLSDARLQRAKETNYTFTSANGYGLRNTGSPFYDPWPAYDEETVARQALMHPEVTCTIDVMQCFGGHDFDKDTYAGELQSCADVFRQVAFKETTCGDCLIAALLAKSGRSGLEAFLPKAGKGPAEPAGTAPPPIGDSIKDWRNADFGAGRAVAAKNGWSLRNYAIRSIQRYSYAIGETPSQFISLRVPVVVENDLKDIRNSLMRSDGPALVTLNDDIEVASRVSAIDLLMDDWHNSMWPYPTEFEV